MNKKLKGFTFITDVIRKLRLSDMNAHPLRGFTFIELLVAVSIILVFSTLFVTNFIQQSKKGRDGERKSDFHKIQVALEDYNNDASCYPPREALVCPGSLSPYLPTIPCEPQAGQSYRYEPENSSCPSFYWIYTNLENETDPDIAKSGCSGGCGPGNAYNFRIGSPNAR